MSKKQVNSATSSVKSTDFSGLPQPFTNGNTDDIPQPSQQQQPQ
ncbi:hypothetical protein K4G61_g5095, partial [Candida parapsilosis]